MSIITSSHTDGNEPDGMPIPAGPASPVNPSATETGLGHARPTDEDAEPSHRRRRWPIALVAVGVAATAGIIYAVGADGSSATDAAEPATIRAVTAEQRDLIEFTELDGTLGYAEVDTVAASTTGTVTALVGDGDTVTRGDTVHAIDAVPITVFYGTTPLYRSLDVGDEGDDVLLLEANLASLGYHIDEPDDGDDEIDAGFTVDGVFDAATADAVERWQADLDVEETGRFEFASVVVTPGPAIASAVRVDVGDLVQAGTPLFDLNVTATEAAFHSAHTGEIELVAGPGPVTTGQVLYTTDDRPITAIVTDETFDRDLVDGVSDGVDVRIVEEMLVALGYDARGDLVPDDEFDELTTEAIEDWQDDLADAWDADGDAVVVDGQLDLDDVVIVAPGTTVGAATSRDGSITATGSELFTWTDTSQQRIVTTAIDVAEQDELAEGASVEIELPDGTLITGEVAEVATSSTIDPTDPDAEATLAVEIAVTSVPDSIAGLSELDVEVQLVEQLAANATVVPASALVVTADGGYAVEVVDGTTTSFVAVQPGMFADGFVEVTGIQPGTAVVVPS